MKIRVLMTMLLAASVWQSAAAADVDAVTLSRDGRILRAQGTPSAVQVTPFTLEPLFEPETVPATCRAVDMAGVLSSRDGGTPSRPQLDGVPYGDRLLAAWVEAASIVGREPESMYYCMTTDGAKVFGTSTAYNPAYEYRKAKNAAPERGQVVSVIDGNVVIGVVFWAKSEPPAESKYLSMHFGR